jgi:ATP-dependent DNA helicase RecQ
MRADVLEHLRSVFALEALRPEQATAIEAFVAGRDVLAVLPTGYGKSLCYQLPAVTLARAGLGCTLVVSPLIALMNDQVHSLRARGVRAAALHSGVPWSEQKAVLAELDAHELVYMSPERLDNTRVRGRLHAFARVAIDEAHCISEWGHDFRPDYAKLGFVKRELGLPVMGVTATATVRVRQHIVSSLGLTEPRVVAISSARPNLRFRVAHADSAQTRTQWAVELLKARGFGKKRVEERAIVYANTRARVQAVQRALRKAGIRAGYYHAGRRESARGGAEERFRVGTTPVLVATSAFGMGVDFADVRLVLHVEAPGTLESYVQQAGRAGRDGQQAECWLAFSPADYNTHARLRRATHGDQVERDFRELEAYALGERCRQMAIALHFGFGDERSCGVCDVCEDVEAVRAARVAASGALATRKKRSEPAPFCSLDDEGRASIVAFIAAMPKPVGRRYVMMALRGSRARALGKKRLLANPHFGVLRSASELAIFEAFDALLAAGKLVRKGKKYPTLWVADKPVRARKERSEKKEPSSLEAALRRFRKNEARRRRLKPYQVFQDRTLRALCVERPTTLPSLREVWGIGEERAEKYGRALIELCATLGSAATG